MIKNIAYVEHNSYVDNIDNKFKITEENLLS